MCRVQRSI